MGKRLFAARYASMSTEVSTAKGFVAVPTVVGGCWDTRHDVFIVKDTS